MKNLLLIVLATSLQTQAMFSSRSKERKEFKEREELFEPIEKKYLR